LSGAEGREIERGGSAGVVPAAGSGRAAAADGAGGERGTRPAGGLAQQRRNLPDAPGVYLFRDTGGRVLYVGKAKSIRKRVASHFSSRHARGVPGHAEMVAAVAHVECVVVTNEAEALLAEQSFIKQYRPRFNIRLRDDKSYPFIGISLEEEFPRVYFTRERHLPGRAYFGPYSNAKRVRSTLEVLTKVFMFRSCTGPEPGRRSGSPCLDYYIKRCQAPCVGLVTREEYRRGVDSAMDFLSGRFKTIERDLEARMRAAAAAQEFEQATIERNRLRAVRSLMERQRVANESVGTLDAVAVAVEGSDANAQVFQVRDGILSDRHSFYLSNEAEREAGEVAEQFLLQFYAGGAGGAAAAGPPAAGATQTEGDGGRPAAASGGVAIPALRVVGSELGSAGRPALADALSRARGGPVRLHTPRRGDKLRVLELAERNARLALAQERLRAEHRRQGRAQALEGLQRALALELPPVRIECFDISTLGGTHTVASMVVFEGGTPKKSDYRRFAIRSVQGADDFAAMAEVLGRRYAAYERQLDISPHDGAHDASFASLPGLVVIDGGRGQLSAGLPPLRGFRERGVAVIALAKRLEEVFLPGRSAPLVLDHRSAELQLLQRVRDEAHRFAITHHRGRREKAMRASVLDELPGIGPARKRALLAHFGSPEAVLAASREELQAAPGVPPKVARELHAALHRTG
jgi:excinuclease ABC subunit C